jgi:predicted transcriptional regulator
MVTKQDVLEIVESMPDEATIEDIMYELFLRVELEEGLEDIRNGRTVPNEEVLQKIASWRQSVGQ